MIDWLFQQINNYTFINCELSVLFSTDARWHKPKYTRVFWYSCPAL